METKDFKRTISIYDNYTINEVIKAIKEAREEIEKFDQRESEIREEKKAKGKEISAEEKEEYNAKIQQVKEERKPIKDYLSKLERKKKGLLTRLDKKIKEIETKNSDMQREIDSAKEIINANEKLAEDFGMESTGLEEEMQELKDAVSIRETKINKNVEKLNKLYRIFSDVENENVVEGLQPNVVKSYKNLPKDQIFKNSGESVINIAEGERNEPEIEVNDEDLDMDESKEQEIEQPVKNEIDEEVSSLEEQIRNSAARMKEYRETGNYEQEAAEHEYYNSLISRMNDLKQKQAQPANEQQDSSLEEQIRNSAARMKEYRESGNYEQEVAEHEYYNSLVSRMNDLKAEKQPETKKEEPAKVQENGEIVSLEEEIRKSATRMKEYRETGNYEQEAAEHEYYNSLVSKMNDLKQKQAQPANEQQEEVQPVEIVKEKKTEEKQSTETEKAQTTQAKQQTETGKAQTTQAKQSTETGKVQTTQAKQSTETEKAQTTQAKQQTETEKVQTTQAKQLTETGKAQTTQAKQQTETEKAQTTQVKQQTEQVKAETKSEIKWNSKLTQDQIEELIAEGIEPGDNEYNLYLWNHGINPFEDKMKSKQSTETVKSAADSVLEKYKNDGFGKNAFGWYFNPWKDEFDKDYDPHNDPEYNEKLKKEKTDKVEKTSGNVEKKDKVEENKTEEKATKISLLQRLKNAIKKAIDNVKRYINNFNNKQLPEGTVSEQEKEEYVAKANEVLKETVSTDRVLDAKSRAAMQEREEFLAGIHISKELREEIEVKEDVKEEIKEEAER